MMSPTNRLLPLSGSEQDEIDRHWMRQAILCAQKASAEGEVPVGAVIVKDGVLIASGWNQPIQHHDPSLHAEMVAIRQAALQLNNYRIPNTTLYVTLEPCVMCAGLIFHARVARVVFGARDEKLFNHPERLHNVDVVGGICENECRTLLQTFFQERRKHAHAI